MAGPAPEFVHERRGAALPGERPQFDVAVAGGTLGIFLAAALQVGYTLRPECRGIASPWHLARNCDTGKTCGIRSHAIETT